MDGYLWRHGKLRSSGGTRNRSGETFVRLGVGLATFKQCHDSVMLSAGSSGGCSHSSSSEDARHLKRAHIRPWSLWGLSRRDRDLMSKQPSLLSGSTATIRALHPRRTFDASKADVWSLGVSAYKSEGALQVVARD